MNRITYHAPTGQTLGPAITVAGEGDSTAEAFARRQPGFIAIVWDMDGAPLRSWSFPAKEVAA